LRNCIHILKNAQPECTGICRIVAGLARHVHPFGYEASVLFLGTGWATNLVVAPFALAGVGTGLSGSTGGAIAVTDAGAYVQFGELWGGRFNVGAAAGRWDNAGAYSGQRYHLFAGWSKGF